jgi:hypothetical protein
MVADRLKIFMWASGIIVAVITTLLWAFLDYNFSSLSNTMETKFAGVETRFNTLETRFNTLETRFNALDNKYDALLKIPTDIRLDIVKLQTAVAGPPAVGGDPERPLPPDDSGAAEPRT